MNGSRLPLRASIDYISFSAHVDFIQNKEFIEELNPSHVVLVHGESNGMQRLCNALLSNVEANESIIPIDSSNLHYEVHMPKNAEILSLTFRGELKAKIIGTLSSNLSNSISGLLVTKDHINTIISTSELLQFTDLSYSTIHHRVYVGWKNTHTTGWDFLSNSLTRVFGSQNVLVFKKPVKNIEINCVKIYGIEIFPKDELSDLVIEWTANPFNDMIADAVMILVIQIETLPFSVTDSNSGVKSVTLKKVVEDSREIDQMNKWSTFFSNQFNCTIKENNLLLELDDELALFDPILMSVKSESEIFRKRVENLVQLATAYI
eukprot:NODE_92_length_21543_cov_0.719036.p3 type:complete len:320 gc:universal NODE_92_length_21543_cov_0.719036:14175-15134(+)